MFWDEMLPKEKSNGGRAGSRSNGDGEPWASQHAPETPVSTPSISTPGSALRTAAGNKA